MSTPFRIRGEGSHPRLSSRRLHSFFPCRKTRQQFFTPACQGSRGHTFGNVLIDKSAVPYALLTQQLTISGFTLVLPPQNEGGNLPDSGTKLTFNMLQGAPRCGKTGCEYLAPPRIRRINKVCVQRTAAGASMVLSECSAFMTDRDAAPEPKSRSRQVFAFLFLLAFAIGWFFWGLGKGDLVRTEGLRAIVVKEMIPRENAWIPTVHQRTYLRKLPLYAWTTTWIARQVGGLTEFTARLPSAFLGIAFVLLMYVAGRRFVDPGAGLAAGFLALGNWEVLDYGMRAELDMGVLFFTTAGVLSIGMAWRYSGMARTAFIFMAYAFAILGTFWKAPHVLMTLWLTVLGLTFWQRRSKQAGWLSFAIHPAQVIASLLSLACLALWFNAIAGIAGSSRMGSFVLFEFLARVVPHSFSYVTGLLEAPLHLVGAAGLAAVFAAFLLEPVLRADVAERNPSSYRFLIAWTIPTIIFLFLVPAKAARYDFIVAGGVTLLGVMVWRRYVRHELTALADKRFHTLMLLIDLLVMMAGCGLLVLAVILLLGSKLVSHIPGESCWVIGIAGACILTIGFFGYRVIKTGKRASIGLLFVLLLICLKPLQVWVFIPARSDGESRRPIAQAVDGQVPSGETIYVLSDKPRSDRAGELADIGFYSRHDLRWPRDLDEALAYDESADVRYFLVREKAHERISEELGPALVNLAQFERENDRLFLDRLESIDDANP